uniref:Ecto-NOX disulfide-thiol exchanger 1 n=1 Tax=Ornithorhynchus anatinus TaxID=9258 RepID=A0A6I8N9E4_ORNAN
MEMLTLGVRQRRDRKRSYNSRLTELEELLEDAAVHHRGVFQPHDVRDKTLDQDIVESTKREHKIVTQMMAAAADGLGSIALDTTQLQMSVTDPTAWATAMNNLGMVPVGLAGQQLVSDDGKFSEAITVLLTWIERGEVNRRSANQFYSMVQSANSHVRRLMNEKAAHEEEMEQAKESFKNALSGILTQFEQIVAVFNASARQKAWDHFSKAQRKNIDIWRKHSEELRNAHSEQLMGIRREEEMEMSDDDSIDNPNKKMRIEESALVAQAYALKEENHSLRWQLDAYRNEVELLKQEKGHLFRVEENLTKDQQLQFLKQTMQGMQQLKSTKELVETSGVNHEEVNEINVLAVALGNQDRENNPEKRGPGLKSEKEALLIGIISTFLHVHPFGANIEYLWSYMQQLDTRISANEIEMLLMRLPRMFKQEFSGVGATLEKRWKFCAFEGIKTT